MMPRDNCCVDSDVTPSVAICTGSVHFSPQDTPNDELMPRDNSCVRHDDIPSVAVCTGSVHLSPQATPRDGIDYILSQN